ncbi:MAG: hypothetical protein WCJ14_07765 [Verrucomicrobiota bacterium]
MIHRTLAPTTALAVIAGLALSIMASSAALVPSFVNGDLFLGIRAAGAPGDAESYLVKLGNDATSFTASGALALGNLGADLSGVDKYGASWSSRADLYWGVFGVRDPVGNPTLYVSRQRSSPGTPATPWAALNLTKRQNTANNINTVIQSTSGVPVGYGTRTATANSPVATFQENGSATSSYKYQVTNGATDFGSTSGWSTIEGNFASGAAATVLDVFKIDATGVALFGTVSISSSGVVTFTKPYVAPVDHDGDGFFDFEEALAGTSDNNAADFFKVESVTKGAGGIAVTFHSIDSRTYQVYYREDLGTGSWQLIASVASGPYTDTDPVRTARPKGFYRVGVTSP